MLPPRRRPKLGKRDCLVVLLLASFACGRVGVELLPGKNGTSGPTDTDTDGVMTPPLPSDMETCLASCFNAHGSAECVDGSCVQSCASGYADCDANRANGCEINLESDPSHCGSCRTSCDASSEQCVRGSCERSPCPVGRAECDDDLSLLCETDLTSSSSHCGYCGNACVAAHGSASCMQRSCSLDGCDTGYADCDKLVENGCEADLGSSALHCGGCGNVCRNEHGATRCSAGNCAPQCATGFGDCDGQVENGCETALNTPEQCGMCGRVCPANDGVAMCSAGACSVSCDLSGSYALRFSVPSSWPASTFVASGNGDFSFWSLLRLTQTGTNVSGTLVPCGEVVPDFRSMPIINERYGVSIPNAAFDRTPLPAGVAATATLSANAPGARLTLARTAFLIGASMSDPINGSWPSSQSLNQVDADGDGKPGFSAPYKSSGYNMPPTDTLGMDRAQTAYLATRIVFSLSGALDGCTRSTGSVSPRNLDVHTVGCRVVGNGRDCTQLEADYLDVNAPDFQLGTGTYELTKIANGAACPAVRMALP
jgi:hypothetical protein